MLLTPAIDLVYKMLLDESMELKMADFIYIPFPRKLYDDIVRFSDGTLRPEALAANQVEAWVANSIEFDYGEWGDRAEEVAEIYAPDVYERWRTEDKDASERSKLENRPLVWKSVVVDSGSDVRMSYGGDHHYAKVKGGKIVDKDGSYSPSEWASKIADGTSRNAWRDLWFKEPFGKTWVPAQLLRDQAEQGMTNANGQ